MPTEERPVSYPPAPPRVGCLHSRGEMAGTWDGKGQWTGLPSLPLHSKDCDFLKEH